MGKLIDLTGMKFGRLTVLKRAKNRETRAWWFCECECGNVIEVSGKSLRKERTRSCGCYQKESTSKRFRKHGYSDKPIYNIWLSMKQRCRNKSDASYPFYGGRGIDFCDRWEKFENFLADMGDRPSPKHSLERVDNDKGYCKENCIWATFTTQARNKRMYVVNKTGIKGVYNVRGKFHASIRVNKRLIFLGSFDNPKDAKEAREKAEQKYFR